MNIDNFYTLDYRKKRKFNLDNLYLHIISFNVPYPADYGGVIDIYYKIRALKEAGIRIILHCFTYGRQPSKELESLCFKVYYYQRKKGLRYFFNNLPYITATRNTNIMPKRLLDDNFPVLFEGLHSTYHIKDLISSGKLLIIRTHNIEHSYYKMLARQETRLFKKFFLYTEAWKLKRYEPVLYRADHILGISEKDTAYFAKLYSTAIHIPAFHPEDIPDILPGKGDYILYHGNLSVAENHKAAVFLIKKVFARLKYDVIIAGKDPLPALSGLTEQYPHITLESNPDENRMKHLIQHAQVNILFTFQSTGIKLKLLHTLFCGRFCVVNPAMIEGSSLAELCEVAIDEDEAIIAIDTFMNREFGPDDLKQRKILLEEYSNRTSAEKISRLLYRGG